MSERPQGEKPRHLPSERVVAFIDILGFRSLVGRMASDPALYELVRDSLARLREDARQMSGAGDPFGIDMRILTGLEQAHFSDSVVFSCNIDLAGPAAAARRVVDAAADLAGILLLEGILVRGGVARGWAFHEGNVLFGAGVVAAYDLESRVSRVPRIVIADDVAALLDSQDHRHLLRRDSDGFWFINLLAGRWYGEDIEEYQRLADRLKEWLHFATEDVDLLAKYRWLALLFNAVVDEKRNRRAFDSVEAVGIG